MKIIITVPITEDKKNLFRIDGAETVFTSENDITADTLKDTEIIFGNISTKLINSVPSIKWVQLSSAGANAYTQLREDITLTNCSGAYGEAIAEHMLACILAVEKNLYNYYDTQKEHVWNNLGSVPVMRNLKVVSIGMGDIGSEFAKRMNALGCTVYGVRRTIHDIPDYIEKMFTMDNMDEILPECDVVALSLPETKETAGLFNYERLAQIKEKAVLVNVGRGSAIISSDLIRIMKEGHLKAACLDVTDHEPLPKNDPLWNTEHIYITPHISGRFNAEVTYDKVIDIFLNNLKHYMNKETLEHIVDKTKGY